MTGSTSNVGSHASCAVDHALVQSSLGPLVHVLRRELSPSAARPPRWPRSVRLSWRTGGPVCRTLSKWMCVSTNPAVISLPSTSITSASAINSGSIAAMVPLDIPMSTSAASGPSLVLALRKIVSIAPLVPSVSLGDSGSVSLRYLARSSCRRRPGFGSCAATVAGQLWAH